MKIAINGTGVAGPTLAWWLKRYGFEPILFERSPSLRTGGYIIDFWGAGYDIAEKMGIVPELKKKGYFVKSMRIMQEDGKKSFNLSTEPLIKAVGGRYISIKRSDLAASIFTACQNIETRFGVYVKELQQLQDGVLLELSDGSREKFDLLIGADGLHSSIRSMITRSDEKNEFSLGAHVAAFTLSGYHPREESIYLTYPTLGKQVARFSLRNDETLFLFTFRSEFMKQMPKNTEEEKALIQEIFKDMPWEIPNILSRINETNDFYFDSVSQIRMKNWCSQRVALIGDAAACASLLAGEGTGLAMIEAYVLAGELYQAKGDYRIAFKNYEDRLQKFIQKKQKSALQMISFFAPESRFKLALAKIVLKASSLPILSHLFLGRLAKDKIDLPNYLSPE